MTIASETSRVTYTGTGSVSTYSYTFKIFNETHLKVSVRDTDNVETELVLNSDYTVDAATIGSPSGGSITLTAGSLASGYILIIRRYVPMTQATDIRNQGTFYAESHEDEFDLLVMADQRQQDELDRSLKLSETLTSSSFDPTLPSNLIDHPGTAIIVNDAGDGFAIGPNAGEISTAQAYAEAAQAAADSALAAAEELNVVTYGALGDGSHDDTSAIQSALTAAGVLGGATIIVPPGTYKCTSQLTWPDCSNIWLKGAGIGVSKILFNWGGSPSTTAYGIKMLSATSQYNARISDMTLSGAANNDTAIYELVNVDNNVYDCFFHNLELKWARHSAIRFTQSTIRNRALIKDNYFHDINSTGMTGINGGAILGILNESRISNNCFENVGNSSGFHAVYFGDGADIVISDNVFYGSNSRIQIFGGTAKNVSIAGNTLRLSGITIQDVVGAVVSGNTLYDALLLFQSNSSSILNNMFYLDTLSSNRCMETGASVSNVTISGNSFINSGGAGNNNNGINLTTAGSDSVFIDSNLFVGFYKAMILYGTNHVVSNNRIITTSTAEQIGFLSGSGHVAMQNIVKTGSSGRAVWNTSGAVAVVKGNTIVGNAAEEGGSSGGINTIAQPYVTSGVRAITTNYTLTTNDSVIVADASGGAITVTLPAVTGASGNIGVYKQYTIKRKNSGANSVVVSRAGADTIDGATTKTLGAQYSTVVIVAGPSEWHVLSTFGTVT